MERVLTQEERIKRAEEIYLRRRNLQTPQYRVTKVEKNDEKFEPIKGIKLFKRIGLQITICLLLYCIFYLIYDTNFSFSNATITKTTEILNYDINIQEIYTNVSTYFNSLIDNSKEEIEEHNEIEQQAGEINNTPPQEQQEEVQTQNEEVIQQQETIVQQPIVEETEQTSAEETNLKEIYSLIRPLSRWIYFV